MTQLRLPQKCPGSNHAPNALYGGKGTRRITVRDIAAAKERGEKWPMLTAYDAMTASVFDEAGIPVMLVGDSMGNCHLGYETHRARHARRDDHAVRGRRARHAAGRWSSPTCPSAPTRRARCRRCATPTRLVKEAGVGRGQAGGRRALAPPDRAARRSPASR